MTRTFDADQVPLWLRSELVRVDLVRLTTYSDRAGLTVDERFHFARQNVLFDYNEGGDVEFWPVLVEIGALSTSINHLPSPGDSALLHKPLQITLSNEPYGADDERLINTLRDSHTLENATVEWTQLALAERPTTGRIDISDLVGDEHTFIYRGRVTRVGPISNDSITLACESDMPAIEWRKDLDATKNDPRDYGRRLPMPYGSDVLVRCNGSERGWVTTLAEEIDADHTGATEFTDCSGCAGMSTDPLRLGNEDVLATYVDANTLNINARAQESTTATPHGRGEIAVEMIATSTFTAAGYEVDAINDVYIRNPASDELVRIPSANYTATVANTAFVAGETRATVAFSEANLRTIFEELFGGIASDSTPSTELMKFTTYDTQTIAYSHGAMKDPTGIGSSPRMIGNAAGTYTYIRGWFDTDAIPGNDRVVVRWRTRLHTNCNNTNATYDIRAHCYYYDFDGSPWNGTASEHIWTTMQQNQETYGAVEVGDWHTPDAGTTLADFEGGGPYVDGWSEIKAEIYSAGVDFTVNDWVEWPFFGIEFELEGATGSIKGAVVGFDLEVWARVDGAVAPDETPAYKAGSGNLMEHPADIMRHWIESPAASYSPFYTVLTSDEEGANQDSYTTASISPSADVTVLAVVWNRYTGGGDATNPTISGGGMSSWTQAETVLFASDNPIYRISVFRASDASPGSGTVTIDFSSVTQGECGWCIVQIEDSDPTSNDGVVQTADANTVWGAVASSLTVTLAAFADADNKTFGAFGHTQDTDAITPGSGFEEVYDEPLEQIRVFCEYRDIGDTSVDASCGSNHAWGGLALEITKGSGAASGTSPLEVDSTTYDSCYTNLGSTRKWAFDARTLGSGFEDVLARMAFEARTTLVPEEFATGTKWKMLTALSTYAFSAASGSVTEWDRGGFVEADQDVAHTHASRFTFPYAPDWSRGDGEEAFTGLVVANEDVNDLTVPNDAAFAAVAAAIGSIDAEPLALKCIQEEATAEEIAGYYCHERIRIPGRLFAIKGVPWWEGYALEVGDIIEATPPWESAAVKCRVIEYVKDPSTEQIELRLVEVE